MIQLAVIMPKLATQMRELYDAIDKAQPQPVERTCPAGMSLDERGRQIIAWVQSIKPEDAAVIEQRWGLTPAKLLENLSECNAKILSMHSMNRGRR